MEANEQVYIQFYCVYPSRSVRKAIREGSLENKERVHNTRKVPYGIRMKML